MKLFVCLVLLVGGWASGNDSVEELYKEAMEIRLKLGGKRSETKRVAGILLEAAGLGQQQLKHPSPLPSNFTAHRGVLRELSFALEIGRGVPRNELLALQFMHRSAQLGDPIAQGEMAIRYAYGFAEDASYSQSKLTSFHQVPVHAHHPFTPLQGDKAISLLYATFAAFSNDSMSQMALGYRHMNGQGVPRNCPSAAAYYNAIAQDVIELARFPGTLPLIDKTRLGFRSHHYQRRAKVEQWLQYYQYSADLGDVEAQTTVGQLFNFGSHGIKRDYTQAFYYFQQAAESGDASAMGHLGHMYANGLGIERNNATALEWFKKAADAGDPNGHYGLGYMYYAGYGVEKDLKKAFYHFNKAASQEHTEAQFSLGVMHLKGQATRMSPIRAMAFFTAASHGGHLLAMYNLAMMHVSGTGIEPNCHSAVRLLKQVAEHGPWCAVLQDGFNAFQNGDYTHALMSYLRAAHMGLELGQSNAAWMLEHGFAPGNMSDNVRMALGLYKSSAEQENANSLLAVGDIYYYGRGIPKDWNRSSGVYQLAEKQKSSRAAFNLGFMYQFGIGLPQDFKLAKRYYALASTYNNDAFYASMLSLGYLRLHIWWSHIRSAIPSFLHLWIDPLFSTPYHDASHIPDGWWSGRRSDRKHAQKNESIMDRAMSIFDLDMIGDVFQELVDSFTTEDIGDVLESVFLTALIVMFIAVYRRRRNRNPRRANRNAANAQPDARVVEQGERQEERQGVQQPQGNE